MDGNVWSQAVIAAKKGSRYRHGFRMKHHIQDFSWNGICLFKMDYQDPREEADVEAPKDTISDQFDEQLREDLNVGTLLEGQRSKDQHITLLQSDLIAAKRPISEEYLNLSWVLKRILSSAIDTFIIRPLRRLSQIVEAAFKPFARSSAIQLTRYVNRPMREKGSPRKPPWRLIQQGQQAVGGHKRH